MTKRTEIAYNFALNQFFDWLGIRKITPETVQEYDKINRKNKKNRISAIRRYCQENNIADPYANVVVKRTRFRSGNPTLVTATTRNIYAGQARMIKNFCGVDVITEDNVIAYKESRRGTVPNFRNFEAKITTVFNWYKACLEEGLDTDPIVREHNRQDISYHTRRGYARMMNQLVKWCGTDKITEEHLEAYLQAHENKWGDDFLDKQKKNRGAFKWYLDCKEKGIDVDFAPVLTFKDIGPSARESYALDWDRVMKWCNSKGITEDITEEILNDFISANSGLISNVDHFQSRFMTAFKWYNHCVQHGKSIKRNEPTIDGIKPNLAIQYEKILKHVITVLNGDLDFTDKQALDALGEEYRHKIDLFKGALSFRQTTKDKGLILRLKKTKQKVARGTSTAGTARKRSIAAAPQGSSSLLLYSDHQKPLKKRVNLEAVAERCELGLETVAGYMRRVARFQVFAQSDKITPDGWLWYVKKGCGSASSVAREKLALQWYCIDNGLPLPFELIDVRRQKGKTYTKADRTAVKIKHNFPPCVMCDGKNVSNPRRGDLFTKVCDSCYEKNYARTARHTQIQKDKQVRRDMALPPAQRIERNAVSSTTSWRRHR